MLGYLNMKYSLDSFAHTVSLKTGFDKLSKPEQIIINKMHTRIEKKAQHQAKRGYCLLCGKPCTSFCNSHSIPEFVLRSIAENGKVCAPLQGQLPTSKKDTGINKAGVFHIICNECDNSVFQDYEKSEAYSFVPTQKMLAQIALKNFLQMIEKRSTERIFYSLLEQRSKNIISTFDHNHRIEDIDYFDYKIRMDYALKSLSKEHETRYHLCFYRILDYTVPYAIQAPIPLVADLQDCCINNLYNMSPKYQLEYLHTVVFPLRGKTVVMLFIEEGTKRYRKFIKQINKLSPDDQLSVINYIIFCNAENCFMNPTIYNSISCNPTFINACYKSIHVQSPFYINDPLAVVIREYSLSQRNSMPNLLSENYSIPPMRILENTDSNVSEDPKS